MADKPEYDTLLPPMRESELDALLAVERERCAKLSEQWESTLRPGTEARLLGHQEARREIAEAIRSLTVTAARGE